MIEYFEEAARNHKYCPETGRIWRRKKTTGEWSETALSVDSGGYNRICATVNKKSKEIAAHRFAWYIHYGEIPNEIDHINRIKTDNRIQNLANGTHADNMRNREYINTGRKYPSYGINKKGNFIGVTQTKGSRFFQYKFMSEGKDYYKSGFLTPEEANEARIKHIKEIFG